MKTIAYIGDFSFSKMNAECQLVLGNAYVFRELGYNVVFIGNDNSWKNGECYDSFPIYNVRCTKGLQDIVYSSKIHREIVSVLEKYNICSIVCYGTPTFFIELMYIRMWAKKKRIPFIINCVDIPNLSHGSKLQRIIKTIDRKLRYAIYRKSDGLIAVSEYIKEYFATNNSKPVIVVPPLRKIDEFYKYRCKTKDSDYVRLVYGGAPFPTDGREVSVQGYKDRLDLAIELVSELVKKEIHVRFDIYGLTSQEYLRVVKKHKEVMNKNKESIVFHGVISHDECMYRFAEADFLILLRNDVEMNKAGFSTKIVDAISCGTKAITTKVGDLQKYLVENEDVYYVDIENVDKSVNKLVEFLNTVSDSKVNKDIFDYHNYVNDFSRFFDKFVMPGGKQQ